MQKRKGVVLGRIACVVHVIAMGTFVGWPPFVPGWLAGVTLAVAALSGLIALFCVYVIVQDDRKRQ